MKASKAVFLVFLILLSLCVVSVQPIESQFFGSAYIKADGSVVGTDRIQRNGNLYTLTGNISGGIQVQKSSIIIDGAGYTVQGNGTGRGLDLSNGSGEDSSRTPSSNVTIKNLRIVNFNHGIDDANANNNTFIGNYVANCQDGFWIGGSANNTITYNTIENNVNGVSINYAGGNNVITENNMINSEVKSNNVIIVWLSPQPTVDRNYWSDYLTRYPNAKEIGSSGIGDTPYVYSGNLADNHPLMKPVNISAENSWTTKIPMLTSRSGLGVAVVKGKICAIGGSNGSYLNVNEEYDPATNTWATKKPMPTARGTFGIAVYQNKIYVIGGATANGFTNANEAYDPKTDTWETKAPMPKGGRSELAASVVDGKIYLIGGYFLGVYWIPSSLTEVYDPETDTWTTKASMPTAVYGCTSAVVDNKIYVIENSYSGEIKNLGLNQIYDVETDKWSYGQRLPVRAAEAAAAATTGIYAPKRIYVIGGGDVSAAGLNQVYDPETDAWTTDVQMPTPRQSLGVAVVNDMLYAIGGGYYVDGIFTATNKNEEYTPFGFGTPTEPQQSQPFPTTWIIVVIAIMAIVLAVIFGVAVYRRKGLTSSKPS